MFATQSMAKKNGRAAWLAFAVALLAQGCFTPPNQVDPVNVQCQVTDDCPSGYVCRLPGKVGGCCRPSDQTCGLLNDASPIDVAQELDGASIVDGKNGGIDEPAADAGSNIEASPGETGGAAGTDGPQGSGGSDGRLELDSGGLDLPIDVPIPPRQDAGNVCGDGACSNCVQGGECSLPDSPCRKGVLTCTGGVSKCDDVGPKADLTACDDGNACTTGEACHGGVCNGGTPRICTASDSCHGAGTCDPLTGACSNPTGNEGGACNDGNACTQTDKCQSGQCVGTNPVTCTALDACHVAGTCNTSTGQCSNPVGNEGGSCTDPSTPCLVGKVCRSGVCQGGSTKSCLASDLCHTPGSCDPTTGICSTPAKTCVAKGQCYQVGTCDPSTGECSNPLQPDGFACSDSNPCTINDSCYQGTCTRGTAVECIDNGGSCYPPGQCTPNGTTYTCVYSSTPYPDGTACLASPGNWGTCSVYQSTGISVCLLL